MFHIELRQFPHNACRFNLGEDDVRWIVDRWVRDAVVDFGERKWSPHQARLTIIEGPELSLDELTMGRGWKAAERSGEDVTERVLALGREAAQRAAEAAHAAELAEAVKAAQGDDAAGPPVSGDGGPASQGSGASSAPTSPAPAAVAATPADALAVGVQMASLLGSDPTRLLEQWRAAAAASPELSPSQSLALAEHNLRSATGSDG